jgi:hypothetical protein
MAVGVEICNDARTEPESTGAKGYDRPKSAGAVAQEQPDAVAAVVPVAVAHDEVRAAVGVEVSREYQANIQSTRGVGRGGGKTAVSVAGDNRDVFEVRYGEVRLAIAVEIARNNRVGP